MAEGVKLIRASVGNNHHKFCMNILLSVYTNSLQSIHGEAGSLWTSHESSTDGTGYRPNTSLMSCYMEFLGCVRETFEFGGKTENLIKSVNCFFSSFFSPIIFNTAT